jgi:hypothetical protein
MVFSRSPFLAREDDLPIVLDADDGPAAQFRGVQRGTIRLVVGSGLRPASAGKRGYCEFDASNRPEGWNATLTLSFPL